MEKSSEVIDSNLENDADVAIVSHAKKICQLVVDYDRHLRQPTIGLTS